MGKKKDKKVKGAEKTLKKTEKNLDKKVKKELREKGEVCTVALVLLNCNIGYSYVFGDARLFKQYSFRLSSFNLRKISFISVASV